MRPSVPSGRTTKAALAVLAVLAVAKAAGLVLLAQGVANGLAGAFSGEPSGWRGAALVAACGVVVRAAAEWGSLQAGRWAAVGVREDLRARLVGSALERGGRAAPNASAGEEGDDGAARVASSAAATAVLAVRGLDALDAYYTAYLPALVQCAAIPLLVGARILDTDWVSALIIALTLPLVPVFMILIGRHTEDRVAAAQQALARLGTHLVELAQGLPVLVGLGRAGEQRRALRAISEEFSSRTMATLRVAFMSSLALELLSTISVAVVAVFIGIRLVNGELSLETGILALVLAPECFQPVRDLGTAHHASQDGIEALRRAEEAIARPRGTALARESCGASSSGLSTPTDLRAEGLTVRYAGREDAVLDGIGFTAPAGEITLIAGPSGAGKTTLLHAVAGLVRDGAGADVHGVLEGAEPERIAYVPQHPQFTEPSVGAELALAADGIPRDDAAAAIREALDAVLCEGLAAAAPAELSPGEQRRIAVARGLLRVHAGATLLLLDEPTAHLDARAASAVEAALAALRGRATMLLIAHAPETAALARKQVVLAAGPHTRTDLDRRGPRGVGRFDVDPTAAGPRGPRNAQPRDDGQPAPALMLRALWSLARPDLARYLVAALAGLGSAAAAAALAGLSGWLIVRAAEHPPILYLLAAIVGVRFFGIARAALRYAERLATHAAVFATLAALRDRLWQALTSRGLSARRLLVPGAALESLIGDAESVRDELPRVVQPVATAFLLATAALVAVGWLLPQQIPALAAAELLALVVAPLATRWADRRAAPDVQAGRSRLLERIGQALSAADDLKANGLAPRVLASLEGDDRRLAALERRGIAAEGLGKALVIVATGFAAVATLAVGNAPPPVLAAVVMLELALAEPFAAASTAAQRIPALRSALRSLTQAAREAPEGGAAEGRASLGAPIAGMGVEGAPFEGLAIEGLAAGWPGSPDAFRGLAAAAGPGEWLVVAGPSGSGKTTLLAVLLGFLAPREGTIRVGGRVAWCPQESHLFDSTVRGNLAVARPRDEAPNDDELWAVLDRVGLDDHVRALPGGLDARIGSRGSQLSGGQRQRLAVARTLVAGAAVVLLDEPTAHLDPEAAHELVSALHAALEDRTVVMVTHRASELREGDLLVRLDALGDGVRRFALAS
ncbi:thiol reductant ABC exporter subunit CydD [Sinomonas sp. JGH33]|uniref:Thiol reductant ABC exporter subunit CydD n=1 Tax=Sinomonas terricola TaxID=3110330 RepID=A0ABU5T3M0_9MICC|nr:thiol reductant ABC exporter subunit CydD [Sinomonas sp. JGH33]MEA5454262.1 thiol reductant ABC exporter subunit CydD [Sinomonas sp. JGH33]